MVSKKTGMATHSTSAFNESEVIRFLTAILEKERMAKAFFSDNDKTPNHDGFFEILNNKTNDANKPPKKQFIVQVKKVENLQPLTQTANKGKYSKKKLYG